MLTVLYKKRVNLPLNREAEGELSLCAGDYLLVWTSGEPQGGYLDAELLDGRRGLVPASFVQRLIGIFLNINCEIIIIIKVIILLYFQFRR